MKRKTGIAALLMLGALPLAALAADPMLPSSSGSPASADPAAGGRPPAMFKQLDANHDGYITKAEAERSATVTALFAKLDTNHDVRISTQEYVKGMPN